MSRLSVLVITLFVILFQACLPWSLSYGEEKSQAVISQSASTDIEFEDYMGALQTVQVEVGSETLPFVFDTGGGAKRTPVRM